MRADYLTHRRATGVGFLGVAIHAALTIVLTIYGVLTKDHAGITLAWLSGVGMVAWLALGIVYDQARRERIEAIESEALRQQVAASSVFETGDDEFRVAARRLASMYRFLFPGVSLLIAGLLIGVGLWRYSTARPLLDPANFPAQETRGWALGLFFVVAVTGFVFARYTSGMAKQAVWRNLRAGAAFAVGASLFAVALLIGHFVDFVGPDAVLRYLTVILPLAMVVMGGEIVVNFLLDIYRPRKAGETPTPSFDSRLLGFAASPDTVAQSIADAVNYQFGYNVSGTWGYQLLSTWAPRLAVLGVAVAWGLSGIAIIEPHQRGMVLRFGALVPGREDLGPGLHWKYPWPIDEVVVPEYTQKDEQGRTVVRSRTVTGVRLLELATLPATGEGPILWTNDHGREEFYQILQPSRQAVGGQGRGQGGGQEEDAGRSRNVAVIAAQVPLRYAITDVLKYEQLGEGEVREKLLQTSAQREVIRFLAQFSVDDMLGPKRVEITQQMEARVQKAFDALNPDENGVPRGAGVKVLGFAIAGVHPPKDVAPQFEQVVQAEQNRQAKIEAAKAAAIGELTKVVGSVALAESIAAEIATLQTMTQDAGLSPADAARRGIVEQEQKIQELLARAQGEAASKIFAASADRWQRHMEARGRVAAYRGQLASYNASPELFKTALFFEALTQSMSDARVFVTSEAVSDLRIQYDGQDRDTGTAVFKELTTDPQ